MHQDWPDRVLTFAARTLLFAVKSLCLFVPTFLVVYSTGTILLTALFGILTGTPHLLLSRDLSGVPFIYYAFGTALPLGIIASGLVWGLATMFAAIGKRDKTFVAWLTFLVVVGIFIGGLSAVPVLALGASELKGPGAARTLLAYLCCFMVVGALACALLSPLWFFAYHRWLSPEA